MSAILSSTSTLECRAARLLAGSLVLALLAGCTDDRLSPEPTETPDPGAPGLVLIDTRSASPGIVFGVNNMENPQLNGTYTGAVLSGSLDPNNIMSKLAGARAKGARLVLKLCKGRDDYVTNADGTFSLSKWKTLVSRYRSLALGPYIADGTILGHYLIDEPHRASRWGGKAISPATLEAMAQYSKQIWPDMTTMVRVAPTWLASFSITYRYVDAGWAQYASGKGEVTNWIADEVAAAKRKGLGLVVGMNVLDGGNGSSNIPGWTKGKYAMSATELRTYGTALLAQSYGCGFYNWQYDANYLGRTDIQRAFADLSAKARTHAKTSCRQ